MMAGQVLVFERRIPGVLPIEVQLFRLSEVTEIDNGNGSMIGNETQSNHSLTTFIKRRTNLQLLRLPFERIYDFCIDHSLVCRCPWYTLPSIGIEHTGKG